MQRPQDRFLDALDNSNSPFVHNIEHVRHWQVSIYAVAATGVPQLQYAVGVLSAAV